MEPRLLRRSVRLLLPLEKRTETLLCPLEPRPVFPLFVGDFAAIGHILSEVQDALEQWEPRIDVDSVDVDAR